MRLADDAEQLDFDGRIVLINRRRRSLLVLNETASLVWQDLSSGLGVEDIAGQLADGFGISHALARHDVQAIVAAWQEAGLLGGRSDSAGEEASAPRLPRQPAAIARTYALCGRPIRFEFGDRALEAVIHPLFAPAEVENGEGRDSIGLFAFGDRYLVAVNGARPELQPDIEQALGSAIVHVLDLSYPEARWLAIVHAGAVAGSTGALVLPGTSGSGKSTLTAALVRAGLGYLSDDIAALDRRAGRVLPVPFAVSVKEGAWPVLRRAYPELAGLPVHTDDVRRWRYLDLAAHRAPLAGCPLGAIVFPRYRVGAKTSFSPVSPLDALEGLVQARCWISLERSDVEALLQLLSRLPVHRLEYGSHEDAVSACLELAGVARARPS